MLVQLPMARRMQAFDVVARQQIDGLGNLAVLRSIKPVIERGPSRFVADRCAGMRRQHHLRQRLAELGRDLAARCDMVERLSLVESRHFDRPFDDVAAAVDCKPVRASRDRHDAAIDCGRIRRC